MLEHPTGPEPEPLLAQEPDLWPVYNWIRLARADFRAAQAREDAAVYLRRKR